LLEAAEAVQFGLQVTARGLLDKQGLTGLPAEPEELVE
jgi:hypothetical protein